MRFVIFIIILSSIVFKLPAQKMSLKVERRALKGALIRDIYSDKDGLMWVLKPSRVKKAYGENVINISNTSLSNKPFLRIRETVTGLKYIIDSSSQLFFIEDDTLRAYKHNSKLKDANRGGVFNDFYIDTKGNVHLSFSKTGYIKIQEGQLHYPLKENGIQLNGLGCILLDDGVPFMIKEVKNDQEKTNVSYFTVIDEQFNIIDRQKISFSITGGQSSIARLRNHNFLFAQGGSSKFLIEFNKGGVVNQTTYSNGLNGVFVDKKYGLWLSTTDGEIHYYEKGRIEQVEKVMISGYKSPLVCTDNFEGSIWFRDKNGMYVIKNPGEKYIREKEYGYNFDKISRLSLVDDQIVVSGDGSQLYLIDNVNTTVDSIAVPTLKEKQGVIYDTYYDKRTELLWVSSGNEVGYIKGKEYFPLATTYKGRNLDLSKEQMAFEAKFYQSKYEVDLVVHYDNHFFFIKDSSIVYHSGPYPVEQINNITIVGDSILVSTTEGLFLQHNNQITDLGKQFPELKGTVYCGYYFNNEIWISIREHGLFSLSGNSLELVINPKVKVPIDLLQVNEKEMWCTSKYFNAHFTIDQEGKTKISFYNRTFAASKQILNEAGTEIYGISNGNEIQCLQTENLKRDTICPPGLIIKELFINNERVNKVGHVYNLDQDESLIQINYVAISFKRVPILYRYRMRGINDRWLETEQTGIQFLTLAAGDYQFEVQTKREGEVWSASESLYFEVAPPIWQNWWFILSFVLLVLFVVYQVVAYRFRILRREQQLTIDRLMAEQRALRAQMDPHFVFNIITSVQYLIMSNSNSKAIRFLNMFTKSMRSILDQSSQNNISIFNEIAFLTEYIEMEKFRLENRFTYTINSTKIERLKEQKIPTFMIQPFVENAIKHGIKNKEEQGHIQLDFSQENSFLKVTIIDDGVGREEAQKFKINEEKLGQKSYGVRLIKRRLQLHNAKNNNIQIHDLKDELGNACGTKVVLTIKTL